MYNLTAQIRVATEFYAMTTPYQLLLDRIDAIRTSSGAPWTDDACGVTRLDTQISAFVHIDAYAVESSRHRVLLVGGQSGSEDDVEPVVAALERYATSQRVRNRVALSAIPCANPDGLNLGAGPGNGSGSNPSAGYPPDGGFFNHETDPETRYLWRYVGFMAPDFLVEVLSGDAASWEHSGIETPISRAMNAARMADDDSLLSALTSDLPNSLGQVQGLRLTAPASEVAEEIDRLLTRLMSEETPVISPAREDLARRRGRSAREIGEALAARYGDTLDPVVYTQGVALSGRLRLGALMGEVSTYANGIADLVAPYLSGEKAWYDESATGPAHAGLIWCDEMFEATGDARYRDLLISTAELYRVNDLGTPPPPCDPDYRTEDMFMAGALLGRAYALTGDESFLEIQTNFLLSADIQQDDGLFWHCRSVPYYWGRGNGFAALGYAETLTFLPEDHPHRERLVSMHKRHIDALRRLQRPSGLLCQLLDFPGSYQELTATCMVGYAVARGLRLGWLDDSYREFADSLWSAASERIGTDGHIVDGCTGTGAVNDRRFYLDRAAEFGQDDRTGNLALWCAVEMARLTRGN